MYIHLTWSDALTPAGARVRAPQPANYSMQDEMIQFIRSQQTGVFAVEMLDGSPHGATLHFAYTENPLQFIFLTERKYKKAEPFLRRGKVRATFVIGTNDGVMQTVQLDGTASLTEDTSLIDVYYNKFTDLDKKNLDENDIFLMFTPTWWRYTDWNKPAGKTSLLSDGQVIIT
jgi:general stress protein 26